MSSAATSFDASNLDAYMDELGQWHLELAILRNLVNHILLELDGPDWMTSAAHIAEARFSHLIETCPFLPRLPEVQDSLPLSAVAG
jgi:hypothetical protein